MNKEEFVELIERMMNELDEKQVKKVYDYTQRIWINSTEKKSEINRSFLVWKPLNFFKCWHFISISCPITSNDKAKFLII